MTLLIEDTSRNTLGAWVTEALNRATVAGATVSPFSSPSAGTTYKSACTRTVQQIRDAGGIVWFDAATHAMGIPGVGDFRYYDQWDLWGGDRGDVSKPGLVRDHVRRVLTTQASLGVPPLGPTVLLDHPLAPNRPVAAAMASEALDLSPDAWITIAGSALFWSGTGDLDAYIGAIAQLGARGFFLVVVRSVADLPPLVSSEEIAGLCRTARSLSAFGPVHVSHGDFAGLPAIAAGANSLGTGWDSRQRVCNHSSYLAREVASSGGGWLKRPTFQGLLSSLGRVEAERLFRRDPTLAERLFVGSLHVDAPKEAFLHHARALSDLVAVVAGEGSPKARFEKLAAIYEAAKDDWIQASSAGGLQPRSSECIDPLAEGLNLYAKEEGWT